MLHKYKKILMERLVNEVDDVFAGLEARHVLTENTIQEFELRTPEDNISKMIDDVAFQGEEAFNAFLEVLQFLEKTYLFEKLQGNLDSETDTTDSAADNGKIYSLLENVP